MKFRLVARIAPSGTARSRNLFIGDDCIIRSREPARVVESKTTGYYKSHVRRVNRVNARIRLYSAYDSPS